MNLLKGTRYVRDVFEYVVGMDFVEAFGRKRPRRRIQIVYDVGAHVCTDVEIHGIGEAFSSTSEIQSARAHRSPRRSGQLLRVAGCPAIRRISVWPRRAQGRTAALSIGPSGGCRSTGSMMARYAAVTPVAALISPTSPLTWTTDSNAATHVSRANRRVVHGASGASSAVADVPSSRASARRLFGRLITVVARSGP